MGNHSHAYPGLQSYSFMREVGCQVNNETDTYCYVEAAKSTHPSDLYLYQLPLGLALPNTTVPSCTPCVQSVMSAYAKDGMASSKLRTTYGPAANIVNTACGNEFVATMNDIDGNGAVASRVSWGLASVLGGVALLLLW